MGKTITLEISKQEVEQLDALLDECLATMDRAHEQMLKDQQEIEQSKLRTQAGLDAIWRCLNVEKTL